MEFCLGEGELLRLEGGKRGVVLRCNAGTVWLTKGDGIDYLIPAGRRLVLAKGESALVEALEPAELRLGEAATAGDMTTPVVGLAVC
jgi:hypothetical protein